MLRGIWGDPQRYEETYWSKWKNLYFAGDGAHRDTRGYFWIMGRIDDVMNVSGHASARWKWRARSRHTVGWRKPPSSGGPTTSPAPRSSRS